MERIILYSIIYQRLNNTPPFQLLSESINLHQIWVKTSLKTST